MKPLRDVLWRWSALAFVPGLLLVASGCRMLKTTTELPAKAVTAITPGKDKDAVDPLDLQVQLQRYTDDFTTRSADTLDEYARRVGTEPAHVQALQLKIASSSSVISIASGPNPTISLLDLVSIASLSRLSVEEYWMTTTNGPAFQPWLEVSRVLETNAWQLAARFLKPSQLEELRTLISQWYARNPHSLNVFYARPSEFAAMVPATSEKKGGSLDTLANLVTLDPMSGLDPAVREVTRTRLFAERAMFTFQRMPFLLRMQTELLAHQVARQPGIQEALTNATRLSDSAERIGRAAESLSTTASQLPDRLSTERKEILAALDQHEGKLKDLAAQVSLTLGSGEKMSTSLNTTITTFDGLMKRFGVGEPSSQPAAPDTNSTPFRILDYGEVADQIGSMARELGTLVTSVNQSMPQVERLGQLATADARNLVDHSFRLALILIGVFLLGALFAGLTYRFVAARLARPEPGSPPENTPKVFLTQSRKDTKSL